jgi:hypothetical protein
MAMQLRRWAHMNSIGTPQKRLKSGEKWKYEINIIYNILETLFYLFGGCYRCTRELGSQETTSEGQ